MAAKANKKKKEIIVEVEMDDFELNEEAIHFIAEIFAEEMKERAS